jgi:ATP-dependent Lhr-like helicase
MIWTSSQVIALPTTGAEGFLILAGKRWKIIEINLDQKEILAEPSRGGRLPSFSGKSGPDLHPRIHEKMREILSDTKIPAYLDQVAKEMLQEARNFARESDILHNPFFRNGEELIWFTWCGTRVNRTILGLGLYKDLDVSDEGIALTFEKMSDTEIQKYYSQFLLEQPDPVELARCFPVKAIEKYDGYLADELLSEAFARNYLDLPGALRTINGLSQIY